jgi:hypothetical protein
VAPHQLGGGRLVPGPVRAHERGIRWFGILAHVAHQCLEDESDGPSLSCPTEPPDGATARIRFAQAGSVINNPHDRDPAIFNNLL